MIILRLKAWNSDLSKVRKVSSQYIAYDDLIKNYQEKKGNIDFEIMKSFLIQATPKATRQRNYMPKIEKIFKNSVSHFIQNYRFYQQSLFSRVLLIYQSLNIHRKQLFEIIEKITGSFEQSRIRTFYIYYVSMIELHHDLCPQFKKNIRNYLFDQTLRTDFSARHPFEQNHLIFATQILNAMLMDKQKDLQKAQVLLSFIENVIFPSVQKVSLIEKNCLKTLISTKELIKLHGLISINPKFQKLLDSAFNYYLSQRVQSDKPVVTKQNYNVSFNDKNEMEVGGSHKSFNLSVLGKGMSSIFQTKFQRKLQEIGYDFEKNVMIGLYEYDFLVKGMKYKTYRPFEHLKKGEPFRPISREEWNNFKEMNDAKNIKINEKWPEPIVLNLNGPLHYIDSNVYGNKRITRTDEIKAQVLKNYGYKRFNDIHYAKWEDVDEKGVDIEGFIETALQGNKLSN